MALKAMPVMSEATSLIYYVNLVCQPRMPEKSIQTGSKTATPELFARSHCALLTSEGLSAPLSRVSYWAFAIGARAFGSSARHVADSATHCCFFSPEGQTCVGSGLVDRISSLLNPKAKMPNTRNESTPTTQRFG